MITKNIDGFGDNYSQLFANASKALRAAYKDPNNKDVTDSVYENIDIQSLE